MKNFKRRACLISHERSVEAGYLMHKTWCLMHETRTHAFYIFTTGHITSIYVSMNILMNFWGSAQAIVAWMKYVGVWKATEGLA